MLSQGKYIHAHARTLKRKYNGRVLVFSVPCKRAPVRSSVKMRLGVLQRPWIEPLPAPNKMADTMSARELDGRIRMMFRYILIRASWQRRTCDNEILEYRAACKTQACYSHAILFVQLIYNLFKGEYTAWEVLSA